MNYSQIQEKVTYHPQGKVKGGHTHEEQQKRFKVDNVCETHVTLLRLGVDKEKECGSRCGGESK